MKSAKNWLNLGYLDTGVTNPNLIGFCYCSKGLWGVSSSNVSTALCSKSPHIFKHLNTGGSNGYNSYKK